MSKDRLEDGDLFSQMILKKEHREAIGCVAVESSRVEYFLELMIWSLLKLDEAQGRAVTGGAQFATKLNLLKELVEQICTAPAIEVFTHKEHGLFKRLTDANAKRRQIIHGRWGFPDGTVSLRDLLETMLMETKRIEAEAKFKRATPMPASEVVKVALTYGELHRDLKTFLVDHIPSSL